MIVSFLSSSIVNLGLRGLSMLAKFLLIIYIGKYLSVDELGEYGLFVTTITIAIYFLGLDFYTYNTREILAKEKHERLPLIRDQFIFHLIVYVIVLPLLLTVFTFGLIKTEFIVYFYLILIFEHLSQELYRLYTTLQKPIFANFLLFMRTGLWVYIVIALWYFNVHGTLNLGIVWFGWILGSSISVIIGIIYLKRKYDFKGLTQKINWYWITNGVKVSIPFFIGTLAYKIIEFSDRYMIDYYMTKADVGIYTFFSGIANTINIIVFTLVIMIYYPLLVEQYQSNKMNLFTKSLKNFFFKTVLYSILVAFGISIFIWPVLNFMGKIEMQNHISVLWLLLFANIILNISLVSHYHLFAQKRDLAIRNTTLAGTFINIILNIIFIKLYGLNGAAISTIISFLIIGLLKFKATRTVNDTI